VIGFYVFKFKLTGRTKSKERTPGNPISAPCIGIAHPRSQQLKEGLRGLARVDSEIPSKRSKEARSTAPVSVCETPCVIGDALRGLLSREPPRLAALFFLTERRLHFRLGFFKLMFLRDKGSAQVVKTNHYLPITILGQSSKRRKRVSAQAKPISEVVKEFEQSLENLRPSTRRIYRRAPERRSDALTWNFGSALRLANYWPRSANPPPKRRHESLLS
jgi:hypothetical protein